MLDNPVRRRLLDGGSCLGAMAFEFFTPGLAPTLAAAGAEFVILDTEHSGVGIETLKAQCAFARGAGIVPLVRVPAAGFRHLVSPVLDAGALGIMAPMVETVEQAEQLVAACRYRPEGRRGLAFGLAHDGYGAGDPAATIAAANAAVLTIALIETVAGVAAAEAIAAVPGIDLLWLGHFDLSDSLGIPGRFDDSRYQEAEARVIAAARHAGKPLGWLVNDGAAARAALARGFRCICIGHEAAVLRAAYTAAFAEARRPAEA